MPFTNDRRWRLAPLAVLLCPTCTVDRGDIERWKVTEYGPYKIRTALSDAEQPVELRAAAAVALVEIGQVDEMAADLHALPAAQARVVADAASIGLRRTLDQTGEGGTKLAARAKDALFEIRDLLSPPVRDLSEAAIVGWLAADLAQRSLLGAHGADRVVAAVGGAAAARLIDLLRGPGDAAEVARLLAMVPDAAVRDRAARALVGRAHQERPPRESTFLALARLGGPHVAAHLAEVARAAPEVSARLWALRALQRAPDRAALAAAAAVAADRALVGERAVLRDEAFGVIQEIARLGDPAARDALLSFLQDQDHQVRWRAVGALVESGDAQGLARLLDGLPEACLREPREMHEYLEAPLQRAGASVLPTLRAGLASRSVVGRMVAARALGAIGAADDGPRLDTLAADRTRLVGWSGLPTVGEEARVAAARLRRRPQ